MDPPHLASERMTLKTNMATVYQDQTRSGADGALGLVAGVVLVAAIFVLIFLVARGSPAVFNRTVEDNPGINVQLETPQIPTGGNTGTGTDTGGGGGTTPAPATGGDAGGGATMTQ